MDPNTLFCYWEGPKLTYKQVSYFCFMHIWIQVIASSRKCQLTHQLTQQCKVRISYKTTQTSEGGTLVWAKRDHNCTSWHVDSWHTQHRHSSDIWSTLLWAAGRCPDLHRSSHRSAQWHSSCLSGLPEHPEIHFLLLLLWNTWICGEEKLKMHSYQKAYDIDTFYCKPKKCFCSNL